MTRKIRLLLAILLSMGWLFAIPPQASAAEGLTAYVYDVRGQNNAPYIPQGATPVVTANVSNINFQWGSGNVAGSNRWDDVIVRYTGSIRSDTTKDISFYAPADDGVKLYIDGNLIINDWYDKGGGGSTSSPISFTAGIPKSIELMYYENGGGAWVQLNWNESGSMQVVPAGAFTSQAAPIVKTIGAPRNLTVSDNGSAAVLTWEDPNTGNTQPERYAINFGADGGGWGIATGNGGDVESLKTTMTISYDLLEQLKPSGTVWTFSIRSDNDTEHLYSDLSNQVTLKIGKTAEEIAAEQAASQAIIDAENARLAAIAAEVARLAEIARIAEVARLAEIARLAEVVRLAEIARIAEIARLEREAAALLAAQQEAARIAAEQEALRQAAILAEQNRLAEIARVEAERLIALAEAARIESERLAVLAAQAEADRIAAEQEAARVEAARVAAIAEAARVESERLAAVAAENARLAELARIAEEKRLADLAAEKAKQDAINAENERLAEIAKQAAIKAEQDRLAAEIAAQKAEADRLAAEEKARIQAEIDAKAEADRIAAEKAIADAKAAQEKAAAEAKAAEEARIAAEQAAKEAEAARLKAEEEARIQAEKDAQAKADAAKAEADAAKAEADRLKAEADAKAKAEEDARLEAIKKADEEARAKTEAEKKAQEEANAKAEADRLAQIAKDKAAEEDRIAAEQKAKEAEAAKLKAEADRKIAEQKALSDGKITAEDTKKVLDNINADGKVTQEEVKNIVDAIKKSDQPLTSEQKDLIATVVIAAAVSSGENVTAEQIQDAGIQYKDLPPETPVEVRTSENGETLVITAEVAANVELVTDAGALLNAAFTDPGAALAAIGSIGADMTPGEREEATKMVVATVVATGAALNAVGAASAGSIGGSSGGSRSGGSNSGGSGGGGASGDSKGVRRRKP